MQSHFQEYIEKEKAEMYWYMEIMLMVNTLEIEILLETDIIRCSIYLWRTPNFYFNAENIKASNKSCLSA